MSEHGGRRYLSEITDLMQRILSEEAEPVQAVAEVLAEQIRADRLVHVFGPGGHSNLAAQEVFFRAGGLMHISAILDGGTLLSDGALRSMAMERTPGYGRVVVQDEPARPVKTWNLTYEVSKFKISLVFPDFLHSTGQFCGVPEGFEGA